MARTEASRAGTDLRIARERLGWALPDVAAMLRIRPSYLEALETGRLSQLPGNVYALGFLRGYATALGLDPEDMVRRFKAESGEMGRNTDLVFPSPVPERGLPAGALILLGLVLAGGAYTAWYRLSGEGKLPAETVAPVPARLAPLAQQAVPGPDGRIPVPALPQPPPVTADTSSLEPKQAAAENPLLADPVAELPQPEPVRAVQPAAVPMPSGTPTTAIAMPVLRAPPAPEPASAAQDPGTPGGMPGGTRVVLRFSGDTWVTVKEKGGATLISKLMKAGETFPVPTRPNLVLTTGNAGQTEILVDGGAVPPIGANGAVRKDVAMDPEQLKNGTAVPVSTRRQ